VFGCFISKLFNLWPGGTNTGRSILVILVPVAEEQQPIRTGDGRLVIATWLIFDDHGILGVGVRGVVSAGVGLCTRIGLDATMAVAHACARRPRMVIAVALAGVAIATGGVLIPMSFDSNQPTPLASSEAPPRSMLRRHAL